MFPLKLCTVWIQRYGIVAAVFIVLTFLVIFTLKNNHEANNSHQEKKEIRKVSGFQGANKLNDDAAESILVPKIPSESELKQRWISDKVNRLSKRVKNSNLAKLAFVRPSIKPNYNVHVFYYPWYGNPEHDGEWLHWNHEYLPNWKKEDFKIYPTGRHKPPEDIGSNFYPALGCYSSRDPNIIDKHLKQIHDAGIGVLVVSWYPPNEKDTSDDFFMVLLDAAARHNLHVAPHLEPYEGRNAINQLTHLKYFLNKYANHSALHRMSLREKLLPVFYIYDSYRIDSSAWRELFSVNGQLSVRDTKYDGVFFGLLVDSQHCSEIKKSHFDGFYTYFASNGFSYGSSWKNWSLLARYALDNRLLFVPSVGPGYVDTRVRAWNAASSRHRRHGNYYEVAWRAALAARPPLLAITSFNEWHEGTQIEPARPRPDYMDYEPEGPDFYLNLTNYWIRQYTSQ
ncbi:glycoprotein endo-alpha-1,2-mannosidase [Nilaparvata lugens]|uniref:glycoprotein endo-alpha-1,2-mannosidase n=1 Tax=Nilaparvata lugens TaxID=108931 RepID=UPI00193D8BF9|nr:glycoprotein endo-alpha-1,2-mannosidase [Nilaparvata lugens]